VIEAIIFDLDGVLVDSEQLWDRARRQVARDHGGTWLPEATAAMQGMSSVEWAGHMRDRLGVRLDRQQLIDRVLELGGLTSLFAATVSSEEVPRGKPSPDVYLEAARRLGQVPSSCAAVEDSANGIRAVAAQTVVVAVPNREFRPPDNVLATADLVIDNLSELTVQRLEGLRPLPRRFRLSL
jgi:beta-phosphoglucomutase-like phosphatase (HAD superfamily)